MIYRIKGCALLIITMISGTAQAQTSIDIPPHVAERAIQIAHQVGGARTEIVSVSRVNDLPGLQQATQVKYMDSAGRPQTLTMLPDGIHFIPGPVAQYREAEEQPAAPVISSAPPATRNQPIQTPLTSSTTQTPYTPNGLLLPESFTTLAQGLFEEDLNSAPATYLSLLGQAPAVVDGHNPDRRVFMLFDPACPYCVNKFRELREYIDGGQLTVHWIPVAAVSPAPQYGLLSLVDPMADNTTRLQRLRALASNSRADVGRVREWDDTRRAQANDALTRATSLLAMIRSRENPERPGGTPQTFFADSAGQIRHHFGYNAQHTSMLLREIGVTP